MHVRDILKLSLMKLSLANVVQEVYLKKYIEFIVCFIFGNLMLAERRDFDNFKPIIVFTIP